MLKKGVFVILMLMTCTAIQAQELFSRPYFASDGLGNNSIAEITQDWKGQLWFANYGSGITMYDGDEYIQFDESDGLNNTYTRSLCFDENERLWVGTVGGGINILYEDHFISFNDTIGGISPAIFELFKDSKDNIWIGSKDGLYRYYKGFVEGISETQKVPKRPIECITEDQEGNIWVGFIGEGLYRIKQIKHKNQYQIRSFKTENGLKSNHITALHSLSDGSILVGTFEGLQRLSLLESGNYRVTDNFDNTPQSQVFDIDDSEQFGLCVAFGKKGVYKINQDNSSSKIHSQEEAIAYDLFEDREKHLWISYWQEGVVRLSNSFVTPLEISNLPNQKLPLDLDLFQGKVSLTYTDQIAQWNGNGFQSLGGLNEMELPISESSVYKDSQLIVNYGNGILLYQNDQWENFSQYKEFMNRPVKSMATNEQNLLWFTLKNGPPIFFDGESYTIIRSELIDEIDIYDDVLASDTSLWLASRKNGIIHVFGNQSEQIKPDKLPNNKVVDMAADKDGHLWIAFQGSGIGYYNGDSLTLLGEKQGLSYNIRSIFIDSQGSIWIGTKDGVYVISVDQLADLQTIKAIHIGENSGLPSNQCLPNQIIEDQEHFIWVTTKNGLAKIDPAILNYNPELIFPKLHINHIKLFFEDVNWQKENVQLDPITKLPVNLELEAEQNQISFEVHSVSIGNLSNSYYRYKLEGLESDFSPVSNAPLITYHDLSAGDYRLVIKPCDSQGICSDDYTTFEFSIMKPFYKKWWFFLIVLAIVNSAFYLFVKARDKSLLRAQQLLEQKVAQRTLEIQTQKRIIEDNNRNITDSIKYAKRIQRAIIPKEEDIKKHFPDAFAMYLPKNMVSGDFYMANSYNGKKNLLVSDCTGHGVPGALMSMLGYSLFRDAMRDENIKGPAAVFNFVSRNVIHLLRQRGHEGGSRDGMDASLIEYDPNTEEFEFVGANNPGFMIGEVTFEDENLVKVHEINGTKLYELKPMKQPLGINKSGNSDSFSAIKGTAKRGTKVYLLSDGYADQFGSDLGQENNGKGKKFRIKNLREKLVEIHSFPMDQQHRELHTTMSIWKGALEQVDDITVLGVTL